MEMTYRCDCDAFSTFLGSSYQGKIPTEPRIRISELGPMTAAEHLFQLGLPEVQEGYGLAYP